MAAASHDTKVGQVYAVRELCSGDAAQRIERRLNESRAAIIERLGSLAAAAVRDWEMNEVAKAGARGAAKTQLERRSIELGAKIIFLADRRTPEQ